MPKGIPKKPGEEQTLEGGGTGAGSGRMSVAERWATRGEPGSNWASLTGPKIPKEIKEEKTFSILFIILCIFGFIGFYIKTEYDLFTKLFWQSPHY